MLLIKGRNHPCKWSIITIVGTVFMPIHTSIKICPSILACNFAALGDEVKKVQDAGADMIHCDIMDGIFVNNISFGPSIVEVVKKCVSIPLDVHLMIKQPERYIDQFVNAGADTIIVHAEECTDISSIIKQIKVYPSIRVGLTVNPDKSIELILPYLDRIDQVLIMTVYAGFGGQKFITDTLQKIQSITDAIIHGNYSVDLEVDGGITDQTAEQCSSHGANFFVSGSYIFKSEEYAPQIQKLRLAAEKGRAVNPGHLLNHKFIH